MASNTRFFFGTTGEYGKYLHWFDEDYVIRNSSMPFNFPISIFKNPWQNLIGWNADGVSGNPQPAEKYQLSYFNTFYAKVNEIDGWSFLSFWDRSGYNGNYNFPTIYALYGSHSFNDLILDMSTNIPDIYNRVINYTGNLIQEYKCVFEPGSLSLSDAHASNNNLLAQVCNSSDSLNYSQYYQFYLNTNTGVEFYTNNNIEADGYFFIHDGYVDSSSASILTRIGGTISDGSPLGKTCYHILPVGNYTLEFTSLNNTYGAYNFIYQLHNNLYDQNIVLNDSPFNSNLSTGVPGYFSGENICNFYYFTINSAENISIVAVPGAFDAVMNLFYADGYGHLGSLISNNGSNNYIVQYLNPGTYGVEIAATNIIGTLDYSISVSNIPEQCNYDLWGNLSAPASEFTIGFLTNLCNSVNRGGCYAKTYEINIDVPANSFCNLIIDYSSTEYDCYLYLLNFVDPTIILAQDDDSGPGTDSQINYFVDNTSNPSPATFTYLIECSSFSPSNTGLFNLTVNVSASPP